MILLYEKKINNVKDLLPLLEEAAKQHIACFVVAEDIDGEALATLVVNKIRGILACAAVKAPGYGDNRKAILEDLAIMTGGKFISADLGVSLEMLKLSDLGRANRIVCDKDTTTIIGGSGSKEAIASRCQELRRMIEKTTSDYERENRWNIA